MRPVKSTGVLSITSRTAVFIGCTEGVEEPLFASNVAAKRTLNSDSLSSSMKGGLALFEVNWLAVSGAEKPCSRLYLDWETSRAVANRFCLSLIYSYGPHIETQQAYCHKAERSTTRQVHGCNSCNCLAPRILFRNSWEF